MTTFVLVGGFWIGAWAWRDVAERLAARGHRPLSLDLTGLGKRCAAGSCSVTLETHISDVVRFVVANDLRNVVLVGHSGGGAIVNAAATRIPDRIAGLVFVDSGPVPDGASIADFSGPNGRGDLVRTAAKFGGGWRIPLPAFEDMADASLVGLDEEKCARLRAHAADQPLHVAIDPVRLSGRQVPPELPRWAILCSMPLVAVRDLIASGNPWFAPMGGPQWTLRELPTGHWPMLSEPERLAEMLAEWPGVSMPVVAEAERPRVAVA